MRSVSAVVNDRIGASLDEVAVGKSASGPVRAQGCSREPSQKAPRGIPLPDLARGDLDVARSPTRTRAHGDGFDSGRTIQL